MSDESFLPSKRDAPIWLNVVDLGDILDSCRMQNAEVGFPDSCI
jgi:hypothetical protein